MTQIASPNNAVLQCKIGQPFGEFTKGSLKPTGESLSALCHSEYSEESPFATRDSSLYSE